MLASAILPDTSTIVTESDNCSSQYKSANYFSDLQYVSDKHNKVIILLCSVGSHRKDEIDHGRVAEVAV